MDVRDSIKRNSQRVEVEDTPTIPVPKEVVVNTIRLVLLRNTNLKIRGSVTGIQYYFPGAGSQVEVDEKDAPRMLDMRRNSCNCSGMPGLPYFEIVGG